MPKEAAGSGIAKKHISTACTWCRSRKVKCDGQTPTCSNCVLYNQRCEYDYSDKRRLSHKKTIQSLQSRVALLESLLQRHGIDVPTESTLGLRDGSGEGARYDDAPSMDFGQVDVQPEFPTTIQHRNSDEPWMATNEIGSLQPDVDLLQSRTTPWHNIYEVNHESSNLMQIGHQTHQFDHLPAESSALAVDAAPHRLTLDPTCSLQGSNPTANAQIHRLRAISHVSPPSCSTDPDRPSDDDDIMDQLSARIGAFQIAEDGQLRYFGATSNLHILHDGLSSLSQGHSRSVRIEGEEILARAGLNRKIDEDLARHLEDLYFRWEDPAIHVVDEEMYFVAQKAYYSGQDGSPFYSETLKNAICAAGSSLTSRVDLGLPPDAATFFSSRAKLLLEIEMDSPSVATVQALVIMSATEAAFTRDARGWLYSGMAVRLSADLGLHLDLTSDVQNGILSARELDVRRTTFWGVFVHDNMWSLYVGRPWGINIQDISISRPPKNMDKIRAKRWNSSSNIPETISESGEEKQGWYDPVEACADANVSLCAMMRQLSQTVYSDKVLSEQQLQEFAAGMRTEFNAWEDKLPAELRIDLSDEPRFYLPHVLQLHMQFYAISILLHRPFFSRSVKKSDSLSQLSSNDPRCICISAAQSIIKLLRIYRRQHTLRRTNVHIVHLIFTASLICVYNTCISKGAAAISSGNDLQFCCQALGEIGQAYQNATRALEVIICIKREWFSKSRNLSRVKKRGSVAGNDNTDGVGRKKRFTQSPNEVALTSSIGAGSPVASYGGMADVGNENPQQLNTWRFQNDNIGQPIDAESFFDNIFTSGGEYSVLCPGVRPFGGSF